MLEGHGSAMRNPIHGQTPTSPVPGSLEEADLYRRSGLTSQGPSLFYGIFLLAIAIAPIFLLDPGVLRTIAIVNAITHFVTGFSWTMVGTSRSVYVKEFGKTVWLFTVLIAQVLLVLSVVLLIF